MRRLPIVVMALAVLLAAAAPASADAVSCAPPVDAAGNGNGVLEVRASGVTCVTARRVAVRAVRRSDGRIRRSFTSGGRRWRCRVTGTRAGDAPSYIRWTGVRCASGSRVVRLQVAS
ncbi:hypothetical protein [Patulibacter minatonensis]|uniref:hypothetical protein n=1 Tax=Patulibacter minatonensis TaxID=298163 RepID=UPI00047D7794|nr:hypothetical protein [Patulibacter minatonensis]